jgi:hypothetical protein
MVLFVRNSAHSKNVKSPRKGKKEKVPMNGTDKYWAVNQFVPPRFSMNTGVISFFVELSLGALPLIFNHAIHPLSLCHKD